MLRVIFLALAVVGCTDERVYLPRSGIEFRLGELRGGEGLRPVASTDGNGQRYVHLDIVLGSREIKYLRAGPVDDGRATVDFLFTPEGAQRMKRASEAHVGRPLALLVDGKLVSFAIINGVIGENIRVPVDPPGTLQATLDRLGTRN